MQHLFIQHLFRGNKFYNIVGEEDETVVNIQHAPYTVDDLIVPTEFNDLIASTLQKIQTLSERIDSEAYKKLTLFVDPIDGTREFATGQGEKVTILLGYNDPQGKPCAGIVYRPLTDPPTWAAGAQSENCRMGVLDVTDDPKPQGILITDGKVSPWLETFIAEMKYEKVPSVASGNRALMLLEGKAGAYIRDTGGFAKWDTSGPQAVVEAYGGSMSKLTSFLKDQSLQGYIHLKSPNQSNLDFVPELTYLTLSNAKVKSDFVKGADKKIASLEQVKEYSCTCGLVALAPPSPPSIPTSSSSSSSSQLISRLHSAMLQAAQVHAPTFN